MRKLLTILIGLACSVAGIMLLVLAPRSWRCERTATAVSLVSFAPDGQTMLILRANGQQVELWQTTDEQPRAVYSVAGHTRGITSARFAPDGKTVLTASEDGTAKLWDAASGQLLRTFQGDAVEVWSANFTPDGRTVLTASLDGTVRLWDTASGQLVRTFQSHTEPVTSASFAPDGKTVLTASRDGTARQWDAASGQLLHTFQAHGEGVLSTCLAPDGKTALTGGVGGEALLWDVRTGDLLRPLCPRLLGNGWLPVGAVLFVLPWAVLFVRRKRAVPRPRISRATPHPKDD